MLAVAMVALASGRGEHSRELAAEARECASWLEGTRGVYRDEHTQQARDGGFTSQFCQDRSLFEEVFAPALGRRRGTYVDVASNHFKRISNTYFLDRCLGWRGVCVEPNPIYHAGLRANRSCDLIPSCVSDSTAEVELVLPREEWLGGLGGVGGGRLMDYVGSRKRAALRQSGVAASHRARCKLLGEELVRRGLQRIDLLSLDVEGHEDHVLRGVDFKRIHIDHVLCERTGVASRRTPDQRRVGCTSILSRLGYTRVRLNGLCGGDDVLWRHPNASSPYRALLT